MLAVIVSNGDLGDGEKLKAMLPSIDTVICCDGGIRHLGALGLEPDLIVGDFDSVDHALLDGYRSKGVPTKTFPSVKNETDTELAAIAAVKLGAKKIILLGALGSRWDHSYGNVMVLVKLAKLGVDAVILNSHNQIRVSNLGLTLTAKQGQILSLLPLGENVVVRSTEGLAYPIYNRKLPMDTPYGISNVFSSQKVEIQIESGWLMAVLSED